MINRLSVSRHNHQVKQVFEAKVHHNIFDTEASGKHDNWLVRTLEQHPRVSRAHSRCRNEPGCQTRVVRLVLQHACQELEDEPETLGAT